jgi:hypothetical protein
MTLPRPVLVLAAALVVALLLGVQRAEAATVLGSPDPTVAPEAFACAAAACPDGKSVGFRQFALQGSDVVAEEPGVLVSARVNAKRIAGAAQPRIAVLRPAQDDGIGVSVDGFAPLPVVSTVAAVHEVQDLHLPVEAGDSVGFLIPTGQVDLGTRARPRPDGAVQWFTEPCGPCHMDGGTGTELLFDATIEPDIDGDRLGDDTQDPDAGGGDELFDDEAFDDWFDELDEEEESLPTRRRRLRLLALDSARNGDPVLKVATPGPGRLSGVVTTSAGGWDIAGIPRTIGAGEVRSKRAGRKRLRLRLSPAGKRMLRRPGRQRARVVVAIRSQRALTVAMRQVRLKGPAARERARSRGRSRVAAAA